MLTEKDLHLLWKSIEYYVNNKANEIEIYDYAELAVRLNNLTYEKFRVSKQ